MNFIPNQLQDSWRHGSLSFNFMSVLSLARSILWWRWLIITMISASIFEAPPCQALCFICSISFKPPNNSTRQTLLLSPFKRWGNWGRKRLSDYSRLHSWYSCPGVTILTQCKLLTIMGSYGKYTAGAIWTESGPSKGTLIRTRSATGSQTHETFGEATHKDRIQT